MAEQIEISKLKPHERNSEFFDNMIDDNWKEFLESIKQSGIIEAITVTPDFMIVSGHQRVKACQELHIETIPYIIKQYEATEIITVEDAILLDLIDANLKQRGGGNPNAMKMARCIREERIADMGTTIRPELSENNKYWIERHRYYELKHFCLQYPIWKKAYKALDGLSKRPEDLAALSKSNAVSDPTAKCAIAKTFYSERMEMIERVASDTDSELSSYNFTSRHGRHFLHRIES